jgi:hypothetical protein
VHSAGFSHHRVPAAFAAAFPTDAPSTQAQHPLFRVSVVRQSLVRISVPLMTSNKCCDDVGWRTYLGTSQRNHDPWTDLVYTLPMVLAVNWSLGFFC